ncbi:bifunctional ADP-dependent NAD(P)H-hydrate dehydratase/NAD(P)H-hydrate epimerase [Thermoplasma volcanium]|nr:bifunctional ADP-dependent NAD(P)H-hydrate dehydratase/NAD(P)H-hydrate epimerase [Thermoplasma volcanium]
MGYYDDMRHDDLNYEYLYGSTYPLMKNAGSSVAKVIEKNFASGQKVCVVCGTGNNAGDAIVAAELLRTKFEVTVLLVNGLKSELAKKALQEYGGNVVDASHIDECLAADIIIDGIFGVGISGEPKEPYKSTIEKINASGKKIVSVDVPSGLGTNCAVRPDITVTFTSLKYGMNKENSGEIIVADIGIPDDVRKYAGPGDLIYYPRPDPDSHKGMNGTLGIVAGWEYHGSSVIAALAAENLGLDLVRIYVTNKNYEIVSSYDPGIIVRLFDYKRQASYEEVWRNSALLIGPGLGTSHEAEIALKRLVNGSAVPIVIDADGITLLSKHLSIIKGKKIVVTPHKNEFRKLTGTEPNEENAVEFAKEKGIIIVLKGKVDIITDGKEVHYAKGGNARMTMGGTGDLLAGLISSFISKGIDPMRSCLMGTYLNKRIGELAYDKKGLFYKITDMIDEIPSVMASYVR